MYVLQKKKEERRCFEWGQNCPQIKFPNLSTINKISIKLVKVNRIDINFK